MKLLVPVKMVPNPTLPVRLSRETKKHQPDIDHIPLIINPFDEIALEEAVLLREAKIADQVIALSIGPESWDGELRTALALGADRAVRINSNSLISQLSIAKCLKEYAIKESIELIICGRQGVDLDRGTIGPMTAALLGWGQATFVSKLKISDRVISITREVDGGQEEIVLPLPAVITTELGLNTPRYASLPSIMQARRKPLEQLSAQELGLELENDIMVDQYLEPPPRPPVIRLNSVGELKDILTQKGFLS
ncbi:MAG: electron transfer flavoprotein subunit beta/FixA family protein [Magnetococcales bacterium]|nr:electron transfer flavoprotein subunit beta/FixA family protein [Magnetococcales bacterium]